VIPLSFVICTTGQRESLLDEVVIPGILQQPLAEFEIVIAGRYAGRHAARVRVVDAPTGREVFHKPFQVGVLAAAHPWIVDLDDDMLLAPDWGERLREAEIQHPGLYGFPMLNPDGTPFGTYFDAVDNRLSGRRRATSYFSSYIAPAELFRRVPYPTYPSGDRAHALKSRAEHPGLTCRLLQRSKVTHLGEAVGHQGLSRKTATEQVIALRPLLKFLADNRVAWIPFADRHLDGRPDITLGEVWEAAQAAVRDPDFTQSDHWLL